MHEVGRWGNIETSPPCLRWVVMQEKPSTRDNTMAEERLSDSPWDRGTKPDWEESHPSLTEYISPNIQAFTDFGFHKCTC